MGEDGVSFSYILLTIAIVIIIAFVISKADTKRALLSSIGLDLSDSTYKTIKEREFAKYCQIALLNASKSLHHNYNSERDFLWSLICTLGEARVSSKSNCLYVPDHYIQFAWLVANRRYEELDKSKYCKPLINESLNIKKYRKKYVMLLWKKYQYPWNSDWLKEDKL